MRDFILCLLLLACLAVLIGLPVVLIAATVSQDVSSALAENIMLVKGTFAAWFVSVIIVSTAGNK